VSRIAVEEELSSAIVLYFFFYINETHTILCGSLKKMIHPPGNDEHHDTPSRNFIGIAFIFIGVAFILRPREYNI
jgi:hypothetical protein